MDERKQYQYALARSDEAWIAHERDRIAAERARTPYNSADAVLGEMLREVLLLAKAMEEMRAEIAALRAEIAQLRYSR